MNFLLLEPAELDGGGRVVVGGRRAAHVLGVLRAEVGQTLRVGVVGGRLGTAVVRAVAPGEVALDATLDRDPEPADDVLLLAVPRPKVLLRLYAHAAALGFGRIVLFRSWRVDKSHLGSSALRPEVQAEQLRLGLEQAGRTALPTVHFCPRFRPMVEDVLPQLMLPTARFVAHPAAPASTADLAPLPRAPFALAIGPDGGFLQYEVDALARLSFLPVACGRHALRTETALAVLAGQLDLLRRRGSLGR